MASNDRYATDALAAAPTHGEWTTDTLCGKCRELDLGFEIGPGISNSVNHTYVYHASSCPFCQFIDAIARAAHASSTTVRNTPETDASGNDLDVLAPITRGLLYLDTMVMSHDEGRHLNDGYLLRVMPNLPRLRDDHWPGSAQNLRDVYAWSCVNQVVPYLPLRRTSVDSNFMKLCIACCQTQHVKQCANPDQGSVARLNNSSEFHLIDCKERTLVQAHGGLKYVALSYVWGKPNQQEDSATKTQTKGEPLLPIHLPKTIEDAIKVTLQLGFQYLWVDKYCITQSVQHGELQRQLATMDSIYHCAAITIIAASGENADSGLPGVSSKPRSAPLSITINGVTWASGVRDTHTAVAKSVWATRGWTYQEDFFARRRLIFTEEQVFFECKQYWGNESLPLAISAKGDLSTYLSVVSLQKSRSALSLIDHIKVFTNRDLTYQSDALDALQGIFASFSREPRPIKQLWGIPTATIGYGPRFRHNDLHSILAFGLTWDNAGSESATRREGFPSWSWAGWITPVNWVVVNAVTEVPVRFSVLKQDGIFMSLTEDLIDSILLDNHNKTSIYTYKLRIEAEVAHVRFCDFREHFGYGGWQTSTYNFKYAVLGVDESNVKHVWLLHHTPTTEDREVLHEVLCREDKVKCVLVSSGYGIVVREVKGVYERLGLLELRSRHSRYVDYFHRGEKYGNTDGLHLRDFFPVTVQEVILG
ncbi:heterokaryon incompatibility protein-domain-containing protein [Phaeosphaeria sp. MPI-PUGE-AT-0046c]|nr:heterokaryon incompatibility protein-domain-containing protein [Phaeosphaeria sp. MPI-PUGE-AT-0046c]